jgi:hypothetical protein
MPSGKESKLDGELDRLYGLPLNEFTPARDELAKRLRAQGQRGIADQVKSLRKATVGAWLSNQLARERQLDVQRLVKAGESLSKAQINAASGASTEAFADARREEQRALERLAQAAREIAGREDASASAVERATQTLRAAVLSEDGRELLRRGRLTEDLQPPGFEALAGLAGGGSPRRPQAPSRREGAVERDERQQAVREARERLRRLRAEERELTKRAGAVEKQAGRAEKEAAERREQAGAARAEAASASDAVAAAQKDLERLQARR